jgi:uncharacterized membrane protein
VRLTPVILVLHCATATAASFLGLGDLPGGRHESKAWDVSADGSVVVGSAHNGEQIAVKWDAAGNLQPFTDISGHFRGEARGVSADGRTFVGDGFFAAPTGLHGFNTTTLTVALGLSGDGSTAVGYSENPLNPRPIKYAWADGASPQVLPGFPGTPGHGISYGASFDGSVIAGSLSMTPTGATESLGLQAVLWTAQGIQSLGDLSGGKFRSEAYRVSPDGRIVVGSGTTAAGFEAFIWTTETGIQLIGDLSGGGVFSQPLDLTPDGSIVVGGSRVNQSSSTYEAFIWTQAVGMRRLDDVLQEAGVDLGGWRLQAAHGISADGTVIVGNGRNPAGNTEAFRAVIPEPSMVLACATSLLVLRSTRSRSSVR